MATLYCDFENGNDNYAGSSFALLASGTDGRISSTTFSSATANFPNDGSLIGQYLSIFNGTIYAVYNITAWVSSTSLTIAAISSGTGLANQTTDRQFYIGGRWKSLTSGATAVRIIPGDTVRIMGSPAPTSLGQNGVWTSQALQAAKNISSSTNATPISITCTAHGYSTGDTVVITGHTTNTDANGTWEITSTGANTFTLDGSAGNGVGGATGTVRLRNNTRVMLTTAVTQNIASTGPGRAAWTNATNVVTGLETTNYKEHQYADSITINAAFTTGKAAHYALPATLDLSSYQQVSFWFRCQTGAATTAGQFELRLCSDATGDTVVNTISIPALGAVQRWQPITVDTGAALGSSIASISLYVNTDPSTSNNHVYQINNIIACKASSAADSLTLTSLIGKNTEGETFWGIQSISGRRVMLDANTNAAPTSTSVRGYYGTSGTVTTWKRETIKLGPAAASSTALQTIQESSNDGTPTTYSGGWDRTNMSTQNLQTWLDGVNGNGMINLATRSYITLDKLVFVRFDMPYQNFGIFTTLISHSHLCCTSSFGLFIADALKYALFLDFVTQNTGTGVRVSNSSGSLTLNHEVLSNAGGGVFADTPGSIGDALIIKGTGLGRIANNTTYGINAGRCPAFSGITTIDNGTGIITSGAYPVNLINCSLLESVETSVTRSDAIFSHNHDQTAGNHKIFMNGALVSAAVDERKTASGISWKIQPTNAIRSSSWPVTLSLAKVAVAANALVTVKAWMRRDNSGLTMRLVCKGGQIAGVANDVTASVTTTNAWEEETITFTPTETGVVEITAEAWGGTTFSGWVDDLTISQATPPPPETDTDALAYIAAVEAADGQALEQGVKDAIVAFVTGCKADNIWNAIKASCILAGARTLSGALIPLKGTAPTNNNFASSDYDRKTGLNGNGSNKFLDSNRANNSDPQDSQHLSVYLSAGDTGSNKIYIGSRSSVAYAGDSYIGTSQVKSRNSSGINDILGSSGELGFLGINRNQSAGYTYRKLELSTNVTTSSVAPSSPNVFVFGDAASSNLTTSRIAFYSIGEALELGALEDRLATLINAFSTAIP